jgi:hypothetical protein
MSKRSCSTQDEVPDKNKRFRCTVNEQHDDKAQHSDMIIKQETNKQQQADMKVKKESIHQETNKQQQADMKVKKESIHQETNKQQHPELLKVRSSVTVKEFERAVHFIVSGIKSTVDYWIKVVYGLKLIFGTSLLNVDQCEMLLNIVDTVPKDASCLKNFLVALCDTPWKVDINLGSFGVCYYGNLGDVPKRLDIDPLLDYNAHFITKCPQILRKK